MKRFATKAVAVVLAVVFVMSFAACSGGKKAEAGTLKVGVLAPLTGSVAEYGNAVNNGIVQFVEELNAKGGVNGKQIELVTCDEEGLQTMRQLGLNMAFLIHSIRLGLQQFGSPKIKEPLVETHYIR